MTDFPLDRRRGETIDGDEDSGKNVSPEGGSPNYPPGDRARESQAREATAARRVTLAGCAVVTIGAGLLVHFAGGGPAADFAGDALYAVLVFLCLACFAVRARSWAVGLAAVAVCAAIELFQLTGLPAAAATAFPPVALVLGSGFSPVDLLAYAIGVTLAASVDASAVSFAGRHRAAPPS